MAKAGRPKLGNPRVRVSAKITPGTLEKIKSYGKPGAVVREILESWAAQTPAKRIDKEPI